MRLSYVAFLIAIALLAGYFSGETKAHNEDRAMLMATAQGDK